jgi:Ca2+-binding EF-hand superfamily protein
LAKRYKNELAKSITNLMGEFLNYTQPNIPLKDFADGVDMLFNKSEEDLRRFAFKIYDANGDNKLSEQDMFDLLRWSGANKDAHVEIEKLRPIDRFDLFDDVFSLDYIKISTAIKDKKNKTGHSHEEIMAKKLEKLSKPMNLQPKGIGLETKFGMNKPKGLASKPSAGIRNSTSISE